MANIQFPPGGWAMRMKRTIDLSMVEDEEEARMNARRFDILWISFSWCEGTRQSSLSTKPNLYLPLRLCSTFPQLKYHNLQVYSRVWHNMKEGVLLKSHFLQAMEITKTSIIFTLFIRD